MASPPRPLAQLVEHSSPNALDRGQVDLRRLGAPPKAFGKRGVVCCFVVIALSSWLGWMLGASRGTIAIVVTMASLGGCVWFISLHRRLIQSYDRYAIEFQHVAERWESRWRTLLADSQQTATALAQMSDGVIVLSSVGELLLINPSARRLLNLGSSDGLLGRLFSEVVRNPKINELIRDARDQQTSRVESLDLSDGRLVRPLRINVDPIELASGGKLLLIIRDETESKRVEEIRREFVANVSHELKTPLAAIKGYAETVELAIQDDPESASHFMKQIFSQCLRLERLVSDMMQLARAQSGTQTMNLVRLPLRDVIHDALRSCQPIAESKQIELTVGMLGSEAVVIADREATLTIANNLISNALRYTPSKGHVQIGTERKDDCWAIVVTDDGVGIDESEHERIFERFYRVEKTRESAGGGTGIGLSIVKNLALAQAGSVSLESRPGEGATFRVMLPAANLDALPRGNQDALPRADATLR